MSDLVSEQMNACLDNMKYMDNNVVRHDHWILSSKHLKMDFKIQFILWCECELAI